MEAFEADGLRRFGHEAGGFAFRDDLVRVSQERVAGGAFGKFLREEAFIALTSWRPFPRAGKRP